MPNVTLRNSFHNSEVSIRVASLPHTVTPSQERRIRRELCGNRDCQCGDIRGPQWLDDGTPICLDHDWDAPRGNGDFPLVVRER